MKIPSILCMALLAGCAYSDEEISLVGRPFAPECRGDFARKVADVPVHFVPRQALQWGVPGNINGRFMEGRILIADDLRAERRDDTIKWEQCRAYRFKTTGSARWKGDNP